MAVAEAAQDRICWICNASEPADKLVTCCRCKRSTEHTCCMRNKHFGTRVFWYCGECLSTRHTVNRKAEEARPLQELADGCSKFNKFKRSAKRSDTLTCTRSPRPIRSEHNSQPVVQKSLCCAADSTKMLDNCSKGKAAMVDSTHGQLIKPPTNYTSSGTHKARQTKLLAPEEVTLLNSSKRSSRHGRMNELSCRSDKRKFLPPSISRRKSISVYPSASAFEDTSKRIKRPTDAIGPGSSLKCVTTRKDSDLVQEMKDSGTVCCSGFKIRGTNSQEKDLPVALVINGYQKHSQRAFWKGDFDVFHVVSHVYSEIRAHFSGQVSSKVYDTSKHLPKTLNFKALPRKDVWPKAFLLEPPNEKDIGLYFFPCATERHKEKYVHLVERLNSGDHALQTSVDGVELLVFLSNQLPVEYQRLNGETYLWGVFHHLKHEKSRSPELVQFSPCKTDAIPESNICASSGTSFEGRHEAVDTEGNREIQNSDLSVTGVIDLPCVPSPVSNDLNYVNPSSVKIPSENVSKPTDLDDPRGVSSPITPRVSGCSSSQHPNSSHKTTREGSMPSRMDSRGHIVERAVGYTRAASEPHQVQPECLNLQKADASLDTSSGFLEPNSGASNNVKSSVVNVPLKKTTNSIDPDAPPRFSSLRIPVPFGLPSSQHSNRSHETSFKDPMPSRMESSGHIAATTVGSYIPASTPHQMQPKCHNPQKADASLHTSSGFLEANSRRSSNVKSSVVKFPWKNVTKSIDSDATSGSSLRTPGLSGIPSFQHPNSSQEANFKCPMLSSMESRGHVAATNVGGYAPKASKPNEVQPRFNQAQSIVAGLDTPYVQEPNPRDSNYVKSSSVEAISKITKPISQYVHPGFSNFGAPGFPEVTSYQHPSSSSQAIHMDPMSPIRNYGRNEHSTTFGGYPPQQEVQPRFHQGGGPVYQDIRPGFSKFGPPAFPPLPSYSTRPSSLLEISSETAWSSRLDRRGHVTSTIAGGYAIAASQIHEMQPNFPQMPAGPHHPVFRPEFPNFPCYSTRPSSSLEIPFKAAWSPRTAGRDHVPSTTVGGYATAASQQNKMQPNYPQGPGTARSNNEL